LPITVEEFVALIAVTSPAAGSARHQPAEIGAAKLLLHHAVGIGRIGQELDKGLPGWLSVDGARAIPQIGDCGLRHLTEMRQIRSEAGA